jgi:hypothetical protein
MNLYLTKANIPLPGMHRSVAIVKNSEVCLTFKNEEGNIRNVEIVLLDEINPYKIVYRMLIGDMNVKEFKKLFKKPAESPFLKAIKNLKK